MRHCRRPYIITRSRNEAQMYLKIAPCSRARCVHYSINYLFDDPKHYTVH